MESLVYYDQETKDQRFGDCCWHIHNGSSSYLTIKQFNDELLRIEQAIFHD
ncbi:hypothetical protein [Sphingobacterium detergens]|uniref:hypothetical protein n=1 Tax=Sphingobacterium detergens TaxID=1145106 RepID=UPI000F9CA725